MLCGIFRAAAHEKRMTFDGINKKILRDLTQIPAYIPRDIRVKSA